MFKALGCDGLPRGTHVRIRITGLDLLTLDVHATLVARLDEALPSAGEADEEADEEAEAAAPLALAIDVADAGRVDGEPAPAATGGDA